MSGGEYFEWVFTEEEEKKKVELALSLSLSLPSSKPTNLSGWIFVDTADNGEYLWKVNFKLKHEY